MIEGEGSFINRITKTGKKTYDRFFIYVPTELARDSNFPFQSGDGVKITIDAKNKCLKLSKA
jgi:hypothetical protein